MNKLQSINLIESLLNETSARQKGKAKSNALEWLNNLKRLNRLQGQEQVKHYIKLKDNYGKFLKDAKNAQSQYKLDAIFKKFDRYFTGKFVEQFLSQNKIPKVFIARGKTELMPLLDMVIKSIEQGR
jgi:hypothetical protein